LAAAGYFSRSSEADFASWLPKSDKIRRFSQFNPVRVGSLEEKSRLRTQEVYENKQTANPGGLMEKHTTSGGAGKSKIHFSRPAKSDKIRRFSQLNPVHVGSLEEKCR
jgi:hypothetical protein